eukprot:m.79352 g.79352  ORF g.79352 m.79352 type:complete len:105 (-) comp14514_c0_seq25:699-1013(-)
MVMHLVNADADVNARMIDGGTAIFLVNRRVHRNNGIVNRLLAAGLDPNIARKDGYTPLMAAVQSNDVELMRQLIGAGADVNAELPVRHCAELVCMQFPASLTFW